MAKGKEVTALAIELVISEEYVIVLFTFPIISSSVSVMFRVVKKFVSLTSLVGGVTFVKFTLIVVRLSLRQV